LATAERVCSLCDRTDKHLGDRWVATQTDVFGHGVQPRPERVCAIGLPFEHPIKSLSISESKQNPLGLDVETVLVECDAEFGGVQAADGSRWP
jgi:hypothetical protein